MGDGPRGGEAIAEEGGSWLARGGPCILPPGYALLVQPLEQDPVHHRQGHGGSDRCAEPQGVGPSDHGDGGTQDVGLPVQ